MDTMRERDGRTDTGRQQRLRLRIASRGRNGNPPPLEPFVYYGTIAGCLFTFDCLPFGRG